jgi:pyridoxine 5'-phosphate synthase PdxJ
MTKVIAITHARINSEFMVAAEALHNVQAAGPHAKLVTLVIPAERGDIRCTSNLPDCMSLVQVLEDMVRLISSDNSVTLPQIPQIRSEHGNQITD